MTHQSRQHCPMSLTVMKLLDRDDTEVLEVEYIFNGTLEKGGLVVEYTGASVEVSTPFIPHTAGSSKAKKLTGC